MLTTVVPLNIFALNIMFYLQKPTVVLYSFISLNSVSDITKENVKLQHKREVKDHL